MNKRKVRVISLIAMIALLVSLSAAFTPTGRVQAGSNGQQIYFSCPTTIQYDARASYVIIKGINQAGNNVQWQGSAYWINNYWTTYVFTKGWWWVGQVRVYWWQARTNHWYSALFTIPKQQSGSDITYLQCN